ncbi:glycosyl hydrolase family 88 [Sphingomonas sp. Leaf407]|uniref:DUF4861 family protein n=1 Tax=unclassified Sphingomonas TaxID=196159 RepID=UPI0006F93030|nr:MULTISPECIES: DUF4861 family protein [unclassified Sphingomonas]KQN40442.1 glycosyl hydrolase family 88 [Sphingomonas sp. Leaf42]KQT29797.1 glycosyl hydrolase family 88 [Sphingomonas sp. Leaf407]
MRHGWIAAIGLLTTATGPAQDVPLPPIVSPLPEPPAADRRPGARVMLADYRHDDLLWENDRTAHRIYGHALEAVEPPSGSGIDAWGKNVARPFMDRQLRTGDQHGFHGEGIDFYNVGGSRGMGGLGIWFDNKLWASRNFTAHRILRTGGTVAQFEVDYAPWPVDVSRRVWETRRFTLPMGTHFTRMQSVLRSSSPEPLTVGIGLSKKAGGDGPTLSVDRARGVMTLWGPEHRGHGTMGLAIRVDPAAIVGIGQDADNYLIFLRVRPGQPFVYHAGSAWSRGVGGFRSAAVWQTYARDADLDFRPVR